MKLKIVDIADIIIICICILLYTCAKLAFSTHRKKVFFYKFC